MLLPKSQSPGRLRPLLGEGVEDASDLTESSPPSGIAGVAGMDIVVSGYTTELATRGIDSGLLVA